MVIKRLDTCKWGKIQVRLVHLLEAALASFDQDCVGLAIQMRCFPPWNSTPDPAQRRHNIVQLHPEGRSVASIAEYLQMSKL